jgi:hypothetical protein
LRLEPINPALVKISVIDRPDPIGFSVVQAIVVMPSVKGSCAGSIVLVQDGTSGIPQLLGKDGFVLAVDGSGLL